MIGKVIILTRRLTILQEHWIVFVINYLTLMDFFQVCF